MNLPRLFALLAVSIVFVSLLDGERRSSPALTHAGSQAIAASPAIASSTPNVFSAQPLGDAVPTTKPLVIRFDRPVTDRAVMNVTSVPEAPLAASWPDGRTLVLNHPRLRNGTTYQVTVRSEDPTSGGGAFRFSFTTAESATVTGFVAAEPGHPERGVRVTFSVAVDHDAVEAYFLVSPKTDGSFAWPDGKTLVWRPQKLRPGESYRVQVSGLSRDGEIIPPTAWSVRAAAAAKTVVLTFDDDPPSLRRALALLDLLSRYEVRAIFFPTGAWAAAHPGFMLRALAAGHLICNHTYRHADLTALADDAVRFQISNGAGAGSCGLLRPPYMAHSARVDAIAVSLGYSIYLWDVDSNDWRGLSASAIASAVLRAARPGAVVLFHQQAPHTLEALPAIIEGLRASGYELSY